MFLQRQHKFNLCKNGEKNFISSHKAHWQQQLCSRQTYIRGIGVLSYNYCTNKLKFNTISNQLKLLDETIPCRLRGILHASYSAPVIAFSWTSDYAGSSERSVTPDSDWHKWSKKIRKKKVVHVHCMSRRILSGPFPLSFSAIFFIVTPASMWSWQKQGAL